MNTIEILRLADDADALQDALDALMHALGSECSHGKDLSSCHEIEEEYVEDSSHCYWGARYRRVEGALEAKKELLRRAKEEELAHIERVRSAHVQAYGG